MTEPANAPSETRFRFVGETVEDYLHECPDDRDCERCDA